MAIRGARAEDAERLYEICLRTGADGDDATARFLDPRLLGEVWVGPYLRLAPELAFVLEDEASVVQGYVLGALDTAVFEAQCEAAWWPALRARFPLGSFPEDSADEALVRRFHAPPSTPREVTRAHPSDLHIDLLPAAQGAGHGRRLISTLLEALHEAGSPGVHLGTATANQRAVGFYGRLGFRELATAPGVVWLGRRLP